MAVAPTPVAAAPEVPDRAQRATFSARATAFFDWIKNTFVAGVNALASNVYANAQDAASSAANAVASQAAAQAAAASAIAAAGVADFSAATVYAAAARARSLIDRQVYRRLSAGQAAGDPSADPANWALAGIDISTGQPSLRPAALLDFAGSRGVDPRITFTRASTATRTNANGLIELVASGAPRIDYDPVTLACKGLLVEESRTNLLTYSEQFDNAAWTKTSSTITANATTAPDGAATADKVVEAAAAAYHYPHQSQTVSTATAYTLTVYAKAGERTKFDLVLEDTGASAANFDLVNGTVGAPHNAGATNVSSTATILYVGNGWYRCSITRTTVSSTLNTSFRLSNGTTVSYTGDGTSGLYIWGAQLEVGSFPTSYIATTTATVTRAADVATMTGTNFSSWYRQDEGTFVADALGPITGAYIACAGDGTAGNRVLIGHGNIRVVSGGIDQCDTYSGSATANTRFKTSGGYKASSFASSGNGAAVASDSSGSVPVVNALYLASNGAGAAQSITISSLRYYPKRLSNSELQALTA